jgi:hypothetical protein
MEPRRAKRTAKTPTRKRDTGTIRCRPYTYARFKTAAAAEGLPFSKWAVTKLLAACDGREDPSMEELRLLFTVGRHLTRGDG